MRTIRAADIKVGDMLHNRRKRSGAAGKVDLLFDGTELLVVDISGSGTLYCVKPNGRMVTLRPDPDDVVEITR